MADDEVTNPLPPQEPDETGMRQLTSSESLFAITSTHGVEGNKIERGLYKVYIYIFLPRLSLIRLYPGWLFFFFVKSD